MDTATGLIGRRYVERIAELEAEGLTTSDAQAVVDAELLDEEDAEDVDADAEASR